MHLHFFKYVANLLSVFFKLLNPSMSLFTSFNQKVAHRFAPKKPPLMDIIPAAIDKGKIAAMNMLGNNKYVYKGAIPSTLLKIMGIDLMSIGTTNLEQSQYEEIKKIDKERDIYKKLVLNQGKIIGAIILRDKKDLTSISRLIAQELDVSKYKSLLLADNFDYGIFFT